MGKVARKDEQNLTRQAYLQAKVLDNLSSIAHEQSLLFGDIGQEEISDAYSEASSKLHNAARELFPLYPHPAFTAQETQDWLRQNGFN